VDLGVTVDTTGAGWQDGGDLDVTLDLAAEEILNTGVLLTVAGNFSNQELTLEAAANDSWALDTDEVSGEDDLRLYAMIGANQGTPPANTDITTATNLVTATPKRAGQPQADEPGNNNTNKTYEFATTAATQFQNVDGMAVGTTRRLWLRANTPPSTTSDEQQTFTVTVTAVTGTGL
jgi:hypothetical protein